MYDSQAYQTMVLFSRVKMYASMHKQPCDLVACQGNFKKCASECMSLHSQVSPAVV